MSWEEDFRNRYPCPCGKGEYEEIHYSDDWGRTETRYVMLCPSCKEKYVYDHTVIPGHPGDEIERGWVLKSVLEAEHKHRKSVEEKAKTLYFKLWKKKFKSLRTKKQMWEILTLNGKYYPSLGTFYKHTKGYTQEEMTKYIDGFFNYHDLKRVFEVCGVNPGLKYLGANKEEIQRFQSDNLDIQKKHEFIKTKQKGVSFPYSEAKPSEVTDVYWIYAVRKKGKYPKPTPRSGKWLIFVDPENVNEVWVKINKAVEEGKLGDSAKVSTAKPNPLAGGSKAHVICVYTYDWTDEKDVKRIREELRKLGITNKIPYKADEDTLKGKYRITGHRRISKYYE